MMKRIPIGQFRVLFILLGLLFNNFAFSQIEAFKMDEGLRHYDSVATHVALSSQTSYQLDSQVVLVERNGNFSYRSTYTSEQIDNITRKRSTLKRTYNSSSRDTIYELRYDIISDNGVERLLRHFRQRLFPDGGGISIEPQEWYYIRTTKLSPPSTYPQETESYSFDMLGDTIYSGVTTLDQDTILTPNIAGPDFKIVKEQKINDEWIPKSEIYSSFSNRLPEYSFEGIRYYDTDNQVWREGEYSISSVTGDFNLGNTVAFDTAIVGLFTSNPTIETTSQITTDTQVFPITPPITRRQIEVRTTPQRGRIYAEVSSQEEEFNSGGQTTRFNERIFPVDIATGRTQNLLLGASYAEYEYLPGTDLRSYSVNSTTDYFPFSSTIVTSRYYYSQVSDSEDLPTANTTVACFDNTYVDGDKFIALPNQALGEGQVSFLTLGGKLVNSYQLLDDQQLSIERPSVSGVYVLSFIGKGGMCSERVFVP